MSLKSHAQLLCYFPSVLSNFATVVSWSRNLVKLHSKLVSLHLIFGKERLVVLKVVPIIIKKFVLPKQLQICDMYQLIISDLICARKLPVSENYLELQSAYVHSVIFQRRHFPKSLINFGSHVMEPRQFYDVLSFSAITLK